MDTIAIQSVPNFILSDDIVGMSTLVLTPKNHFQLQICHGPKSKHRY